MFVFFFSSLGVVPVIMSHLEGEGGKLSMGLAPSAELSMMASHSNVQGTVGIDLDVWLRRGHK